MNRKETFLWVAAALFFGFGLGALIYKAASKAGSGSTSTSGVLSYQTGDSERPRLLIVGDTVIDLGKIKVSDERKATFTIKNEGQKTLQIIGGTSSCNCTFGQIKTESAQSPLFGMHSTDPFMVEVAPGKEASVDVVYRPYLMPVLGKVQRSVTIKTNDPEKIKVDFVVEATVE